MKLGLEPYSRWRVEGISYRLSSMSFPGMRKPSSTISISRDASPSIRLDSDLLLSSNLQQIGPMEWVMYKPRWGAFYNTALEKHLRNPEVNTVVGCGCNFPNCPRTTIYEASERDFRIVLAKDATSAICDIGLKELKNIGVVLMAKIKRFSHLTTSSYVSGIIKK